MLVSHWLFGYHLLAASSVGRSEGRAAEATLAAALWHDHPLERFPAKAPKLLLKIACFACNQFAIGVFC
jgi:hypothetical protein